MLSLAELTLKLRDGQDLTPAEAAGAAGDLASADVPDSDKEAFLESLAAKGESPAEIAAFAAAFRDKAVNPEVGEWAGRAIDVVGTGGDHAGGFNISSLVTLVLASSGVIVMKHGNRGITSKCGSADLLAALGVDIEATPARSRQALEQLGFCFFFAPAYHPAFRQIAPVRKTLAGRGLRTVFNVLGPLVNPGRPARTLLGVYSPALVGRIAQSLDVLGAESALVVHGIIGGGRGIDELTTATDNHVVGAGRARDVSATWRASDFGMPAADFEDLRGGGVADNLALVDLLLKGRAPGGLADTIVLNAAVGLWLSGRVSDVHEGVAAARDLLLGGAVRNKIAATREFFST